MHTKTTAKHIIINNKIQQKGRTKEQGRQGMAIMIIEYVT